MPDYRFYQLDVFTRTPLTGNPLAVFPDARGLDTATMQALAREMNLSETTFVTTSTVATRKVRFFTPTAEVPLVGHPTIGTWWLLSELGELGTPPTPGTQRVTQETGRGVLPVDLSFGADGLTDVTMTQATPEFGPSATDRAALARALGGDETLLAESPAPQVVSTAIPQLMVPVRSRAQLTALPMGGGGGLAPLLQALGTDCAMLHVVEPDEDGPAAWCRMFAPGLGVPEDPATGSASGALGAYLVRHGVLPPADGRVRFTVRQGGEIGRPSRIRVTVEGESAAIAAVRVGGAAVRVIDGTVHLQPALP